MNTILMSKAGKEKIRVYAISHGCTIKEEGGVCWKTPVIRRGAVARRTIKYVGVCGEKVAVRDSKKGIVCL